MQVAERSHLLRALVDVPLHRVAVSEGVLEQKASVNVRSAIDAPDDASFAVLEEVLSVDEEGTALKDGE